MKYALIFIGSCISSLVIAGVQEQYIRTTNINLIKRTDLPPRKQNQIWKPPGIGSTQPKRERLSRPSSSLKPISEEPEEARVAVDVHGPGTFSGMPIAAGGSYETHVDGGRRQSKTYQGSEVPFAIAASHPHLHVNAPSHVHSTQDMVKMEAKGKRVKQSVSVPAPGAGHISVLSPGEDSPTNIPIASGKSAKVIAETSDPRGVLIKSTTQRGGKADASATNGGKIYGHRIGIDKKNAEP